MTSLKDLIVIANDIIANSESLVNPKVKAWQDSIAILSALPNMEVSIAHLQSLIDIELKNSPDPIEAALSEILCDAKDLGKLNARVKLLKADQPTQSRAVSLDALGTLQKFPTDKLDLFTKNVDKGYSFLAYSTLVGQSKPIHTANGTTYKTSAAFKELLSDWGFELKATEDNEERAGLELSAQQTQYIKIDLTKFISKVKSTDLMKDELWSDFIGIIEGMNEVEETEAEPKVKPANKAKAKAAV